ncbi:DNA cytosine methyltransferase [Herbidospora galbida]|uniref:DNA cytosine methyltransferase n=1 Tax=Herbidospora galbida TaxID=2575442 RepID=A0A4V6XBD5_9ACTN|nr:DNA cytosine methyltransferase [Herbidospora galbida]TKK86453.1 DNA cytosine methyltransferase [Herbidospora galbida]
MNARRRDRPRLLDLFCCAGGAGMGYHLAGFDVTGVDVKPQPNYPFAFRQGDALEYLAAHGHEYDVIHASPPCQFYTSLRHLHPHDHHPDLIGPTRDLLIRSGRPWVMENVPDAPMPGALVLCGSEFALTARCRDGKTRWLKRHRLFETSEFLMGAGGCHCGRRPIGGVYGTGGRGPMPNGSYKFHRSEAADAMGIDWMTMRELTQAIPPAYTRFIGETLVADLTADHIPAAA